MARTQFNIFKLKNVPTPWRRLGGTGLTTTVTMVIGLALGHLEWGIWGFMGGFTSLYVQNQPFRSRGMTLALVGLGMASAMALGALSAIWWEMALVLGFVSAASTYLCGAFDVPLPAGFMFVLVACISAALPQHPPGILMVRVLCVLGGAALAWLVGMSDWLWDRRGPAEHPLHLAFDALGQYMAAIGTAHAAGREYQAATAVATAHRAVLNTACGSRMQALAVQTEKLLRAIIALSSIDTPPAPEWAETLKILGTHVKTPVEKPRPMPDAPPGPQWQRFREVLRDTWDVAQSERPFTTPPQLYRASIHDRLKRALDADSLIFPAFVRIGIAVLLSVVVAHFLGVVHPFWIPLTCAAVLQGVSTVVITQRTIQRALGTVIGLLLTGLVLALHPSAPGVAVAVIVLQLLMLAFIAKNYGISVVFITTMALTIIYAGTHAPVWPMVLARFGDTLLGGAIGLAAAYALWGKASSARLPSAMARVVRRSGRLLEALLRGASYRTIHHLRAQSLDALLTVRHLYETSLGELPETPHATAEMLAIERLGYLVVAVCSTIHTADPALADQLQPIWAAMEGRLDGSSDEPVHHIPSMPRYPAIEHQLWDVLDALDMVPQSAASQSS